MEEAVVSLEPSGRELQPLKGKLNKNTSAAVTKGRRLREITHSSFNAYFQESFPDLFTNP